MGRNYKKGDGSAMSAVKAAMEVQNLTKHESSST